MESLIQDLRYSARALFQRPGFAVVVLLTLALGVGANAAVFSVCDAVLLRALPYREAERIAFVYETRRSDPALEDSMSAPNFADLRARIRAFDAYFAYRAASLALTGAGDPEAIAAAQASADFGRTLGVAPALGRLFDERDDAPGAERVVVIGDGLWKRRFGGAREILGRTIIVDGEPAAVIGVMPPGFDFPSGNTEIWTPLRLDAASQRRGLGFLQTVARLAPGATLETAQSEADAAVARLRADAPDLDPDFAVKLVPLRRVLFGALERPLLVLLGAVAAVLLIACVNVANLALTRALSRRREFALRGALGASRGRLVRLYLMEALLLALLGALAGLALAAFAVPMLLRIDPTAIPARAAVALDARVVVATLIVALVAGLGAGALPAWRSARTAANDALRDGGRGVAGARSLRRTSSALVVAEVALSLLLLFGAALLLESFLNLTRVDPGFAARDVVVGSVSLPASRYPAPASQARFYRAALDQLRTQPGVTAAAFSTSTPFSGSRGTSSFVIEGRADAPGRGPEADRHQVTPGYFAAIGIALRTGRDFTDGDDIAHPAVVIVNEALAQRYWPGENAIGKRISIGLPVEVALYGTSVMREVVGVVGNVKHQALGDAVAPEMYLPAYQAPPAFATLVLRTPTAPDVAIAALRGALRTVDADLPIRRVQPLSTAVAGSLAPQRFAASLLAGFAALALALAAIGIYGVMAHGVAQRTRELGVRMALGARAGQVLAMVLGQGLKLGLLGVAIGVVAAVALSGALQGMIYGVGAADPLTLVGAAVVLLAATLCAALVPARRATRVAPVVALREE